MLNGQKLQGPLAAKEVHVLLKEKGEEAKYVHIYVCPYISHLWCSLFLVFPCSLLFIVSVMKDFLYSSCLRKYRWLNHAYM